MLTRLFSSGEDHGVGLLAAGNLGLSSISSWVAMVEPMLHTLLSIGQIAVAVVTVAYIWKRMRQIGKRARRAHKPKPPTVC